MPDPRSRNSAVSGRTLLLAASALLLVTAGTGCYESPMAFSPDGQQLALVTCDPFPTDKLHLAGPHAFRLMILQDKKFRVLETTTQAMLTGPGYSDDGKQLCYLRIPLMKKKDLLRWRKLYETRGKSLEKMVKATTEAWGLSSRGRRAATQPAEGPKLTTEMRALPPLEDSAMLTVRMLSGPPIEARLIIRRTSDWRVTSDTPVLLPLAGPPGDALPGHYPLVYWQLQPRFSRDGKWVAFLAGGMVIAASPSQRIQKLVAAPAEVAVFSPDARTLAIKAGNGVLGFVRLDRRTALYLRMPGGGFGSIAWLDNKTVVLFQPVKGRRGEPSANMVHVRSDGTIVKTLEVEKAHVPGGGVETAVAPNGEHMIFSHGRSVFFTDADGKVVGTWRGEKRQFTLQKPTFSRDSKRVAMKLIEETGEGKAKTKRTESIVLFTAEGRELSRVTIPKLPAGTTRPGPKLPAATTRLGAKPPEDR